MNKVKINSGLASIILIAAFFAGGGNLLIVTLLMFIFCEIDDKVKNTTTRILTFFLGVAIVSVGWDLLVSGANLLVNCFDKIESSINAFRDYDELIELTKYINPISNIISLADSLVSILITLAKFGFVISLLTNKPGNNNFISRKINEYINIILNYINNIDNPVVASANNVNVAPAQVQTAPVMPKPNPNPSVQNINQQNNQNQ